jgi:hypothetical protein
MKKVSVTIFALWFLGQINFAQDKVNGVHGDVEVIAEARSMVETMGGLEIWAQLKSVHFVHEWWPYHRNDSYIVNKIG